MKLKKNVCLALSLLAFCACTSEDSTLNSSKDSFQAGSIPVVYTIDTISSTADLAKKIALEFPKQSATRSTADKEIKEMLTINDDNGTPAMYVINYRHNEGFIITSATQDYSPVLAYSDDGNFDVNNTEDQPIDVWIEQEKTNIEAVQAAADSIKYKFRAQWLPYVLTPVDLSQEPLTKGSYEDVRDFILENSKEWVSQGYQPIALGAFKGQHYSYYISESLCNTIVREAEQLGTYEYGGVNSTSFVLLKQSDQVTNVDPLTTSRWNQTGGFNTYIPNNYPVGCVGVAIGQIMKYWKYPTQFNWSQITDGASDATASFLYQVATACKTEFGENGSGSYDSDAASALRSYGYSNAKVVDHDVKNARLNIPAKRPIYMSGSRLENGNYIGHAWVCDGIQNTVSGYDIVLKVLQSKTSFYTSNYGVVYNEAYPSTYLHMNWGYSGSNNAFYNDNNIALSNGRDYKYNRKDIINIYH